MEFRIEHPRGVTKWLPGNSTNGGKDEDSFADYIIEQKGQMNPTSVFVGPVGEKSIRTREGLMRAELTVTARDYGGVANLRAYVWFGNQRFKRRGHPRAGAR